MKEKIGASSNDGGIEKGGRRSFNGQYSQKKKIEKRNMQRLGGRGLSLEAFANAKSRTKDDYNPALIKKQREFYKNAKFVKKYKRSLKQEERQNDVPAAGRHFEERDEGEETTRMNQKNKKGRKSGAQSLEEIYKKKREEEEKARIEKEACIQAKQEVKQKAEVRRKSLKEKMYKKTKSGQPVMRYRIEHILETLQGSSST